MPVNISACFVIRFAVGSQSDQYTGVVVRNIFLDTPLDARVSFLTLDARTQTPHAVHPHALQLALFNGDAAPEWIKEAIDPSASEPQTLIRVDCQLPDLRPFWRVTKDGHPERVRDVHDALYTFVMNSAAIALERITAEEENRVSTIFPPDLLGDGVIRFVDPEINEPWHMRMPSRPAMGSFGSHHVGTQLTPDFEPSVAFSVSDYGSPSIGRLFTWQKLFHLRYQRGEWAEAIVGIEAQFEALMWRFLELVLVDHGWRRRDFEAAESLDGGWQVRNTIGALQHHLGGSAASWASAKESFQECWTIRNSVVHRSSLASRSMADRAHEATQEYVSLVLERLRNRDVAHSHPLAATAILGIDVTPDVLGEDLAKRAHELFHGGPLESRNLNDHYERRITVDNLDRRHCPKSKATPIDGFDMSKGRHGDRSDYRFDFTVTDPAPADW